MSLQFGSDKICIGKFSTGIANTISIGYSAISDGVNAICIGNEAKAAGSGGTTGTIAIGYKALKL